MSRAVKIRKLTPPPMPLEDFDPGAYLGSLEFYETEAAIGEEDRDGLAQIAGLSSRQLSGFLLPHYPPKKPKT